MTDLALDTLQESAGSAGATVKLGGSAESISYSWTPESDPVISDAVFAACLLPAMASASSLHVAGPVSPRLLSSAERIQEIFHAWAPDKLHPITVEAERRADSAPEPGTQVACFFSAGVDSFYSTLKHLDEVDALIFVHGFDVGLSDEILRERVTTGVRNAAAELGKPLVEVETEPPRVLESARPLGALPRRSAREHCLAAAADVPAHLRALHSVLPTTDPLGLASAR